MAQLLRSPGTYLLFSLPLSPASHCGEFSCNVCSVWALKTRDNDRTAPDKEAEKGVMIAHIIPENSRRLRYTCSHLFLLQGWFKIWSITCCAKD